MTGNNNTFDIYNFYGDLEVSGNYNEFEIYEVEAPVGRLRISGDYNIFNIYEVSGKLHLKVFFFVDAKDPPMDAGFFPRRDPLFSPKLHIIVPLQYNTAAIQCLI